MWINFGNPCLPTCNKRPFEALNAFISLEAVVEAEERATRIVVSRIQ